MKKQCSAAKTESIKENCEKRKWERCRMNDSNILSLVSCVEERQT